MATRDPDILETYSVAYRSGLEALPHPKSAAITLNLTGNALVLDPTMASRKFWPRLSIPYERIISITRAAHVTSTVEGILGGIGGNNSSRMDTDNNIDLQFRDDAGVVQLVRVEMVTGLTVTGQAAIAHQLENRLDLHGLRARFEPIRAAATPVPEAPTFEPFTDLSPNDIVDLIARLAQLNAAGALTDAEFAQKKTELLGRL